MIVFFSWRFFISHDYISTVGNCNIAIWRPKFIFSCHQVEQLHKIFKLCGSPADEYWKKSKLPHATIFKPHRPYDSCLHETFKSLPASAFSLLETLLSVEPYKRGTATTALASEVSIICRFYFMMSYDWSCDSYSAPPTLSVFCLLLSVREFL